MLVSLTSKRILLRTTTVLWPWARMFRIGTHEGAG